jgi:hypothetical protein
MRKFFNIFLFVLCTIAIAGCNDTESSESKLEIKAVNTNFQVEEGIYNSNQQGISQQMLMPTGVC